MKTMSFAGFTRKSLQLAILVASVTLGTSAMGGRGAKLPEILADHPTKPYNVVASIDTSVISTDPNEMTEQKALPWIRKQAAQAHADAVIDLTRSAYFKGVPRGTASFGQPDWTAPVVKLTGDDLTGMPDAASAMKAVTVVYRANAIQYR